MGKYNLLAKYLSVCNKEEVTLNMKEIEVIIGDDLPSSAYNYSAWWANEVKSKSRHSHAKSWMSEGYRTKDVKLGERVTFVKF